MRFPDSSSDLAQAAGSRRQPRATAQHAPAALRAYGGGWEACLRAQVARVAGRSAIAGLEHRGPLRVQKGLWPEGSDPLHVILLHPPGGIAGGDRLRIEFEVQRGAHALVTTPGAGHWYRADALAMQCVQLSVGERASLEWLPQETIVHDGAQAEASLEVALDEGACAIGWEITVFGRRESAERFGSGVLRQSTRVHRGGRLLLEDASLARGGFGADPASLGGMHVSGLLWAVSSSAMDAGLADATEQAMLATGSVWAGASRVEPHLLLARAVESSPERARAALVAGWEVLRPAVVGRAAQRPRIWAT